MTCMVCPEASPRHTMFRKRPLLTQHFLIDSQVMRQTVKQLGSL